MFFPRRSLLFACILAAFTAAFASPVQAKKKETGFLDRVVTVAGISYKYQVFVPDDWTAKKKWPIILFLYGAGERGDDGLIQTEVGIGTAIRRFPSRVPAIVVLPQCSKDLWWSDPKMESVAMAALTQARREFQGDLQRTYLTGLSMGGYGTWALAADYPGKFAALVPICGGILGPEQARTRSAEDKSPHIEAAKKIGKVPVWIFHGGADDTVPVTESQRMAEAVRTVIGQEAIHTEPHAMIAELAEVIYTEYPGVGHNSWDKAYAEPDLIRWLLSKFLLKKRDVLL